MSFRKVEYLAVSSLMGLTRVYNYTYKCIGKFIDKVKYKCTYRIKLEME